MAGKSVLELIAKAMMSVIVVIVTEAPTLAIVCWSLAIPTMSGERLSSAICIKKRTVVKKNTHSNYTKTLKKCTFESIEIQGVCQKFKRASIYIFFSFCCGIVLLYLWREREREVLSTIPI